MANTGPDKGEAVTDFSRPPGLRQADLVAGIVLIGFVMVAGAMINASGLVAEAWRRPLLLALVAGAVLVAALAVLIRLRMTATKNDTDGRPPAGRE